MEDMGIEIQRAIIIYKLDHPDDINPTIIVTTKKIEYGKPKEQKRQIVGSENDWRSMVRGIVHRRETFKSIIVTEGMRKWLHRLNKWNDIKGKIKCQLK